MNGNDTVDHKDADASPGQCVKIFLVMQLEISAGVLVQLRGYFFVGYRKHKFVGLYRSLDRRFDPGLDEPPFIGFEYIAFVDEIIHGACLRAATEYKVIPVINDARNQQYQDQAGNRNDSSFHKRGFAVQQPGGSYV